MKRKTPGKRIMAMAIVFAMLLSFATITSQAAEVVKTYLYDVDFENGLMTNKATTGYTFAATHDDLHPTVEVVDDGSGSNKALKIDISETQAGSYKLGQKEIEAVSLLNNTTWYEMSVKFEENIPTVMFNVRNDNIDGNYVGIFKIDTAGNFYIDGNPSRSTLINGITFETGKSYDIRIAVDNYNRSGVCPRVYVWVNGIQYMAANADTDGSFIWNNWPGNNTNVVNELVRAELTVSSAATKSTVWFDDFKIYNTNSAMKAGLNIGKYYDINFENSSWDNAVGSTTIGPVTDGHFNPAVSYVDDAVSGSKVATITNDRTCVSGNYGILRDKGISFTSIKENTVVWHEISFRFNEKVFPLRSEAGEYPYYIDENGDLYIGGLASGTYQVAKIPDIKIKADEWYHLVIAVDNIDKWAGTDVKYYAWLNGTFLATGETPMTGCTVSKRYSSTAGMYGLWMIIPSDNSDVSISLDNIKAYTTEKKVKENGVFCFDPMAIYDGTDIEVGNFTLDGDKIIVGETTTIDQLRRDISLEAGATAVFKKDGQIVSDETTLADGATLYVNSDKNVGIRKYSVTIPEFKVTYFDADFESGEVKNNVADGKSFGVTYAGVKTAAVDVDPVRNNNKAYKISLTGTTGDAIRLGNTNAALTEAELDNNTVWTELSFRIDDAVENSNIQFESTNYLFSIVNGELYIGGIGGNTATPSRKVENFTIKSGEWYHLVIALDNENLREVKEEDGTFVGTFPVIYAWVNGEKLNIEGQSSDGALIWAYYSSQIGSPVRINTLGLTIYDKSAGTVYLDNFKLYTTRGGFEKAEYDALSAAAGATLTSDCIRIENAPNGVIYAPEMTIAQLTEKLGTNANGILWFDENGAAADTSASAIGKKAVSLSSSVAVKNYEVIKGSATDFLPVTASFDEDTNIASINISNNTGAPVLRTVIFAVYDGDKLIDCSIIEKTVSSSYDTYVSKELNTAGENIKIKAFMIDKVTLVPETTAILFK